MSVLSFAARCHPRPPRNVLMPGVTACEREPSYLLCLPPGPVGAGGVLGETVVPFTLHFKTGLLPGTPGSIAPSDVRQRDVSGRCTLTGILSRPSSFLCIEASPLGKEGIKLRKGRLALGLDTAFITQRAELVFPWAWAVRGAWGPRFRPTVAHLPGLTSTLHAGSEAGTGMSQWAEMKLESQRGAGNRDSAAPAGWRRRSLGPAWGKTAAGHPKPWVAANPSSWHRAGSNRGQQWDCASVPNGGQSSFLLWVSRGGRRQVLSEAGPPSWLRGASVPHRQGPPGRTSEVSLHPTASGQAGDTWSQP